MYVLFYYFNLSLLLFLLWNAHPLIFTNEQNWTTIIKTPKIKKTHDMDAVKSFYTAPFPI